MNTTPETIIDRFLSGQGSRADVESLRLNLSLTNEERDEVESTLRLVDQLSAAGNTIVVPQGAIERMSNAFRAQAADNETPSPAPRWVWDGKNFSADPMVLRPAQQSDEEDAANVMIEGGSSEFRFLRSTANDASTPETQEFDELQRLVEVLSDPCTRPTVPEGAEDRLVARLHELMDAEGGAANPFVANRFMRQLRACTLPSHYLGSMPDVLAATKDQETEGPGTPGEPAGE